MFGGAIHLPFEETNAVKRALRVRKNEATTAPKSLKRRQVYRWSISYYSGGECYHWTTGVVVESDLLILGYVVWVVNYSGCLCLVVGGGVLHEGQIPLRHMLIYNTT